MNTEDFDNIKPITKTNQWSSKHTNNKSVKGSFDNETTIDGIASNEIDGTKCLRIASDRLNDARTKSKSILSPILERMIRNKSLKNSDQTMKALAKILDYPYNMQISLKKDVYEDVVGVYKKVGVYLNNMYIYHEFDGNKLSRQENDHTILLASSIVSIPLCIGRVDVKLLFV